MYIGFGTPNPSVGDGGYLPTSDSTLLSAADQLGAMSTPRDDDLEERINELQNSLEELQQPRPPRGPGGLPRPPTPRELLTFADQQAIPTAITVLEANIRALELLQAALRLADPGRTAAEEADQTRARAEDLGRRSLDRLDDTLRDLQEAARGDTLPRNDDAREIIEEARQLREEIASRIDETERPRDRPSEADTADTATNGSVEIDIEDELDSIRSELDKDGENDPDDQTGSNR